MYPKSNYAQKLRRLRVCAKKCECIRRSVYCVYKMSEWSDSKHVHPFREALKEADSVKTQSLQILEDEKNKLKQELENNHKGQSELVKVQHLFILFFLMVCTSIRAHVFHLLGVLIMTGFNLIPPPAQG